MKFRQIFLGTVCASVLANPALAGKDALKFSEWDQNGNNLISLEEWDAAIESHDIFENIDENNNGIFDLEEAVDNVIEYDLSMDLDDGGHVERQEFTVGTFNSLDKNNDRSLDNREFMEFSNKVEDSELLASN